MTESRLEVAPQARLTARLRRWALGVALAVASTAAVWWLPPGAGFLAPWEPSAVVLLAWGAVLLWYVIGWWRSLQAGCPPAIGAVTAFLIGMALTYLSLQSRLDYYAQHMFWIHRLQHLVLHHLAPFLLVLSAPGATLARGMPARMRMVAARVAENPILNGLYRFLQQPVVAALLFVGLIYFWLLPGLHYDAMLSASWYKAMNWSMFVDGLLFWAVMLDSKPKHRTRPSYGLRVLILWLIMVPQILLGAFITFSRTDLYEVYAVCGRAWAADPLFDQRMGGLITWIPASMMSVLAALVVLRMWRRDRRNPSAGV